jgi:hypothetical protein
MSKLTLSVDTNVVVKAKRYADRQGTSISKMVETYLAAVSGSVDARELESAPTMTALRGILKHADVEDYRKHLANKYR